MGGSSLATYTEADNGSSVAHAIGDVFDVRLSEAALAGYRWRLGSWDRSVVDVEDGEAVPASSLAGAPRLAIWRFHARSPGDVVIELTYGRAWESSPARSYAVRVSVR